MSKPTTVEEYIAGASGAAAEMLLTLRNLSRNAAPQATEALKWSHPALVHPAGTILFVYSAHKQHANVTFTPSTREAFAEELADFDTGKGSVKLPYGAPVPTQLLERMVAYRVREFEDDGVTWM